MTGTIQPLAAPETDDVDDGAVVTEEVSDGEVVDPEQDENNLEPGVEAETPDPEADNDSADEHGKLPENVQKAVDARIGKEVGRRKTVETERDALKTERDELKAAFDKVSDESVLRAAQDSGVLSELLDKTDAGRIEEYNAAKHSVRVFSDWLEDNMDPEATLELGGRDYSRTEIRAAKRQWQARLDGLEEMPARILELRNSSREIMRLGMAAKKAGWKPGAKPKKPLPTPPKTTGPANAAAPRKPAGESSKQSLNADGVSGVDDLAKLIAKGLR